MQEPYGEGVATHTGPESCAAGRKAGGEALTGVRAGWVMSREIHAPRKRALRGADALGESGRPHQTYRNREVWLDPARSFDPTHVRKHLARKPGDPTPACWKRVRQAASGSPRT
jgi:RNA-directed DNA polymerase